MAMPNEANRAEDGAARIAGLYAIADGGFSPAEKIPDLVRAFVKGGCRIVQLRMKNDATAMPAVARSVAALKQERPFTFIVNDDAQLAIDVGADGVHVGEHDTPVVELRRRYGDRLLIGYSSHTLEEARQAAAAGADYIAFGAIFPTKTKGPGHPVQGLGRLREVASSIRRPVVAIGGIGRQNVAEVVAAGAAAVAMISALAESPDVEAETRWFVREIARKDPRG